MVALLVATGGIVTQILSGADYPAVPPGIVILLFAAGLAPRDERRRVPVG